MAKHSSLTVEESKRRIIYATGDWWIRYIPQPDMDGCGPACLAMLLDVPYEHARVMLGGDQRNADFIDMGKLLRRNGYLSAWSLHYGEGRSWPPHIFAPVMLWQISDPPHWVIVGGEEIVFDPAKPAVRNVRELKRAYPKFDIDYAGGVWPFGSA